MPNLADAKKQFIHSSRQVMRHHCVGAANHHISHLMLSVLPALSAEQFSPLKSGLAPPAGANRANDPPAPASVGIVGTDNNQGTPLAAHGCPA